MVCSDRRVIVWENGASPRVVHNSKKDILNQGIWYLPLHKFWVTAGVDNRLRIHAIGYNNDRTTGKDNDGVVLPPLKKNKDNKDGNDEEEDHDKTKDLRKKLEDIRKKQKFGKKAEYRMEVENQLKKRQEEERKVLDKRKKNEGIKKASDDEEDDSLEYSNRRQKQKKEEKEDEEEINKRQAPHEKKITEVCELNIPRRIATCSLDGSIKLWDISTKTCVVELKDISTARGIRGMSYSHEYGGNLVSYGYETHINVWCPEVSPSQAFIGRLSGHAYTIVCCKFIPAAPNCVSVDDKGNVRIWDIRTLAAIQVISTE
jgi:WD domain, G-beta repeat